MIEIEHFVNIIFSGFLIGILISAPMGPIGMLCIQRTLNKGQFAGLSTGVGAAASDLIYCLLTSLCLSFVEGFINENQVPLQILGSVVLIGYGIFLFHKNPSRELKPQDECKSKYGNDMLSGFLFTFSNPFILFIIIGLFARFNFLAEEFQFYHYIAGYIAIIVGALSWWYMITYFVNKVRAHFNVRSLWLINRVIAVILVIMAVAGLIWGIKDYIIFPSEP